MTTRLFLLVLLVGVAGGVGLILGAKPLWGSTLATILAEPDSALAQLVWSWRLPRVITALCVGACLGAAGAVFQGIFRNPLAEPYLLGSASGAALGAALVLLLPAFMPTVFALPVAAFAGAWGATWLVITLANVAGVREGGGLLLAGVALAAVLSAAKNLLMIAASDESVTLKSVLAWTLGGIQTPDWSAVPAMMILTLVAIVGCVRLGHGLDVLGLGDEVATTHGIAVARFRALAALAGAFATALAVAWGGVVGFIGLMAPHCMRWWIGPTHRLLILTSALAGAGAVAAFDGLARFVLPPSEIPLGLLTALVGGPFFLFVLAREARR